jgi:hypothetical protein
VSRAYEDCGPLVRAAIALARGHEQLQVVNEANAKVVRFLKDGAPALVIEKNKHQLNLWAGYRSAWSSAVDKIDRDDREKGVQKDGQLAVGKNPGHHTGVHGFFKAEKLACFHPSTLENMWDILEEIAS